MDFAADDLALLILRLAVAYVYLHGAWMISRNETVRARTVTRTSVLLDNTPFENNQAVAKLIAYAGVLCMYLGSLGLILGIQTKLAAFLLFLFTVPGIVVHLKERDQALDLVAELDGKNDQELVEQLRASTYAGHQSSANKNYALLGAALFLILTSDPNGTFAIGAY